MTASNGTHGDVLAATYQLAGATDLTPEGATQRFVEDIVSNHAIIAVVKSGKRIRDVWVTDDVTLRRNYALNRLTKRSSSATGLKQMPDNRPTNKRRIMAVAVGSNGSIRRA